jgi:hypothetical protein
MMILTTTEILALSVTKIEAAPLAFLQLTPDDLKRLIGAPPKAEMKRLPEVAALRTKAARNLRDCRREAWRLGNPSMARAARDALRIECRNRRLPVFLSAKDRLA